jgi:S1-C subfamily serine protease
MQILTSHMADYWDISGSNGILVNSIVPGSPAEKAGLRVGDIITRIGELKIPNDDNRNLDVFRNYVRSLPEGKIELNIIRNQKTKTIIADLKSAPMSQFLAEEYKLEHLGFSVKELTQDIILNSNLAFDIEGVWVSRVEEASTASLGGLSVDDLILSINDMKISDLNQFKNKIEEIKRIKPKYIQFFIQRESKTQFIIIKTEYE